MNPFPDDFGSFGYGVTVMACVSVGAFAWCVRSAKVEKPPEPKYPRPVPDDDVPVHYVDSFPMPPRPEWGQTCETTPARYAPSPLNPPPYGP